MSACFYLSYFSFCPKQLLVNFIVTKGEWKMNIVLWILQVLLAIAFLMAGVLKLTQPLDQLGQMMAWVNDSPALLVRFIGLSELLGALGLILPAATRIKPILTPIAAACLALVMILAALTHIVRGEFVEMVPSVVLLILAAFVAYGRFKLIPIAEKGQGGDPAPA